MVTLTLATLLFSVLVTPAQAQVTKPAVDFYNAGKIMVEDGIHVFSAPARLTTSQAIKTIGYLATTGLLLVYDRQIMDMFQRNESVGLFSPIRDVGDWIEPVGHMGNTNAYYFGGVAIGYIIGWDKLTLISAQILEAHFIAGIGKVAIQKVVGRTRPFEDADAYSFGNGDATSFPSGHSINIFQLATILSYHFDRTWFSWAAYSAAGLVGVQRVRSQMHWASDVFLSAVWGTVVARAILKQHEKREMEVAPHISSLGIGVQVGYHF